MKISDMARPAKLLSEVAAIIRSKNAGPFLVTFDIMFKDQESYEMVCDSKALTPETVAKAFGIDVKRITSFFVVPMAKAIKVTIRRPIVQGAIGDSDVYGCQQHVPLMNIRVPVPGDAPV